MKYLKLFEKSSDYQAFINGGGGKFTQCLLLPERK